MEFSIVDNFNVLLKGRTLFSIFTCCCDFFLSLHILIFNFIFSYVYYLIRFGYFHFHLFHIRSFLGMMKIPPFLGLVILVWITEFLLVTLLCYMGNKQRLESRLIWNTRLQIYDWKVNEDMTSSSFLLWLLEKLTMQTLLITPYSLHCNLIGIFVSTNLI